MSTVEAINMFATKFDLDIPQVASLMVRPQGKSFVSIIRNQNHAAKLWIDQGQGTVVTSELQAFLETLGVVTSKSGASNCLCRQRSAQAGVNKYRLKDADVAEYPVAVSGRTGRVRSITGDDANALAALLAPPKAKAAK